MDLFPPVQGAIGYHELALHCLDGFQQLQLDRHEWGSHDAAPIPARSSLKFALAWYVVAVPLEMPIIFPIWLHGMLFLRNRTISFSRVVKTASSIAILATVMFAWFVILASYFRRSLKAAHKTCLTSN
jgi:hypothetical protein